MLLITILANIVLLLQEYQNSGSLCNGTGWKKKLKINKILQIYYFSLNFQQLFAYVSAHYNFPL